MSVKEGRDHFEIAAELRKRVEGDIRFDRYSRLLYSTDASIYQIEPIGVVVPRHKGDVQAVIELANRLNVSGFAARRRHVAGRSGGRPLHRAGFFQIHAERAGSESRRALVPRAAGLGSG